MIDRKEIELLIRSKLQGKGDLAAIVKGIAELEKQIDRQTEAAKRGESSIDELKGSLEQLKQAQQQLTQRAEAIGFFQKLGTAVETTEKRVESAGKAFQQYSDKVKSQGAVTEKEAERLNKLSTTYERAQGRLAKQRQTLDELRTTLVEAGVDVANLTAAENRLREAAANVGLTLNKGQQALGTYAKDVRAARDADAAATKSLDQFTAAEQKATAARLARAKAEDEFNARQAGRKAQGVSDTRQFDELTRVNQQTAKAAEFVKRWAAQLDELDRNTALRKQADDAELASRQYTSLARASATLAPKVLSIRDSVDAIANPAKAARTTLAGVEDSVAKLTKTIQGIKGPVKDASTLYKELDDSQKALASQAGLIENFRRQMEALKQMRTELSAARADVTRYAAEVAKGGESGAQFSKSLADVQAKARDAAEAFRTQLGATRDARVSLRDAGIETNNLVGAEQRLLVSVTATRTGILSLNQAISKLDESARNTALRTQGEDAELASRQYTSLARASGDLAPKLGSVRDAVDAIVNPGKAARTTLAGVEDSVGKLTKTIQEIKGPVKDASALYKELGDSQKALASQAGLIDNFRRQIEALKQSRAELSAARTDVGLYAAEVRKGGESGAQFAKSLADAQARARGVAEAFRGQLETTRDARLALREAGIETNNLVGAEQRLLVSVTATRTGILTLNQAISQLDELARNNSLRKQADDAELASRQYTSLARASGDLAPKLISVRDAVDAIINPAKAARTTLAGVEDSVGKLTKTIQEIKGPVKDANALYKELGDSQKALASQAGLIDNFRRQTEALKQTRAALVQARNDVALYAAEVRKGGESGAQFSKALAEAQGKARGAAEAMRVQVQVTREAKVALRDAGIETNNLAAAEGRLLASVQATRAGVDGLTAAVERHGAARDRAGRGGAGMFGDEGRTTLSLLQRIRGQVLALTAAYVGLQGVVSLAGGAIEASNNRQSAKSILGVSLNTIDKDAIDSEYEYVRAQSERIGLVFEDTVKQYAKFATAAAKSGRSRNEIRYIFEAFAEGGRVLNLTTDNLNGVFLALEQVFSKGKLGAEELRQQLGERLPGVFEIAQQALRDQFPDLNAAMKEGKVGAEQLVKVAEAYRKLVAEQLPGATKAMVAQQARLSNAINEFKISIADSGFADAYLEAVKKITEFLRSDDGKNFAQTLSTGFTALANALVFVLKHLDELKIAFGVILAMWATNLLQRQITDFISAAKAIKGMSGELTGLQKGFYALQAFIIGWNIGSLLRDQFAIIRIAINELIGWFESAWVRIKYGAQILFAEEIPLTVGDMTKRVIDKLTFMVRMSLGLWQQMAKAVGATDAAAGIQKAIDALTVGYSKGVQSKVGALRAQMAADLAAIEKTTVSTNVTLLRHEGVKVVAGVKNLGLPTGMPPPGKASPTGGASDAEIKKRESAIEAITRALEMLDAKIDRTQTDTLSKQLDAIDTQYKALARKIDELGGKEAVGFMEQLAVSVEQLQIQTIRKFNDALLKEQEILQSKIEQFEAGTGRKQKNDLDARLAAVTASYAATYRDIAALREKLLLNNRDTSAADEMARRVDAAVAENKVLETQKFYKDELARREAEINDLLSQRAARIKTINDQLEAGQIDQQTANQQIRDTVEILQPQIEAMAASGAEFAASIQGAFDPVRLAEFIAKLELAKASAGGVNEQFKQMAKTIEDGLVGGAVTAFDTMGVALGELALGTKSWSETVGTLRGAFLQFAADFLRMIAQMILKQIVLNALQSYAKSQGGGIGAGIASLIGAGAKRAGGMVGSGSGVTRNVPTEWFANAPRYQAGGIPGLAVDEYATILHRNEEVLAAANPRNILNGGAAAHGGDKQRPISARFVLVDDRTKIPEAMAAPEGEQVILQHVKRNIATLRQWIKG